MKYLSLFLLLNINISEIMADDFFVDDFNSFFDDVNPGDGVCAGDFTATCTLHAAIQETNATPGSHRIFLPAGTHINASLSKSFHIIDSDIEIIGEGMNATIIDARQLDQAFNLSRSSVTFKDLSIINGKALAGNPSPLGGAIYAITGPSELSTLILNRVKLSNNSANNGGAVRCVNMNVAIYSSVLLNNTLEDLGVTNMRGSAISILRGGIKIYDSSISNNTNGLSAIVIIDSGIDMQNTTVSNNDSIGLDTQNVSAKIKFSTFSNNNYNLSHFSFDGSRLMEIDSSLVQNATTRNCLTSPTQKPTSLGYNISDDASCEFLQATDMESTDAQLGILMNNGGTTASHLPAVTSPAIDNIPLTDCLNIIDDPLTNDQRHFLRPVAMACDSGSVERRLETVFIDDFE